MKDGGRCSEAGESQFDGQKNKNSFFCHNNNDERSGVSRRSFRAQNASDTTLPQLYDFDDRFAAVLTVPVFFFADFGVAFAPLVFEVGRAADFVAAVFGATAFAEAVRDLDFCRNFWRTGAVAAGSAAAFFVLRFFFAGFATSPAMLSNSIPKIAPRSLESNPPLPLVLSSRSRFPAAMACDTNS